MCVLCIAWSLLVVAVLYFYFLEALFRHNKVFSKVSYITNIAQVVWGPVGYMFSRLAGKGHVRDREKLSSCSFIILSSTTNLFFCSTLYNQRLACKLNRPVFDRTHLVLAYYTRILQRPRIIVGHPHKILYFIFGCPCHLKYR